MLRRPAALYCCTLTLEEQLAKVKAALAVEVVKFDHANKHLVATQARIPVLDSQLNDIKGTILQLQCSTDANTRETSLVEAECNALREATCGLEGLKGQAQQLRSQIDTVNLMREAAVRQAAANLQQAEELELKLSQRRAPQSHLHKAVVPNTLHQGKPLSRSQDHLASPEDAAKPEGHGHTALLASAGATGGGSDSCWEQTADAPAGNRLDWEVCLSTLNPVVSPGFSPAASLEHVYTSAAAQHTSCSRPEDSLPEVLGPFWCASPQLSTQELTGSQPGPKPAVEARGQQQHMRPDGSPITQGGSDTSRAAPSAPAGPQHQQGPRAAQQANVKQQSAVPRAAGPSKPPATAVKTAGQPGREAAKPKVAGHKARWNNSTRVSHRGAK